MLKFNTQAWDLHHSLILIGSTLGGAVLGFIQSQDPGTIFSALTSWQTAKPLLFGALYAGLAALLALAKQTFVAPTAPTGGATAGDNPDAVNRGGSVPRAPGMFRTWSTRAAACTGLALVVCLTGCAQAAQWWTQFSANPVQQVTSFVQSVTSFIQMAETVWALLSPLLGASAPQANADFQNAVVTLQNALVVAEDAVQAAAAAQQPTIDVAALMKPVQDAVTRVLAVIQQWKAQAPGAQLGDSHSALVAHAKTITGWRF